MSSMMPAIKFELDNDFANRYGEVTNSIYIIITQHSGRRDYLTLKYRITSNNYLFEAICSE